MEDTDRILNELTESLFYKGYALYPYQNSVAKNKVPIPFGIIYPESYCLENDFVHNRMQTTCIIKGTPDSRLEIWLKFLQIDNPADLPEVEWRAVKRELASPELSVKELLESKKVFSFRFPDNLAADAIANEPRCIEGYLTIEASEVVQRQDAFIVSAIIVNTTPVEKTQFTAGNEILNYAFVSTHTILKLTGGEFISDQNPGKEWKDIATRCKNIITWPVLFNDENTIVLSSPIILHDYPRISQESSDDLINCTEIEESLILHQQEPSENEGKQMPKSDEKLHDIINRVKCMSPEEIISLHDKLKRHDK